MQLNCKGGLEILVFEGDVRDGVEVLVEGSWARYAPGIDLHLQSEQGARCYVKSGHPL